MTTFVCPGCTMPLDIKLQHGKSITLSCMSCDLDKTYVDDDLLKAAYDEGRRYPHDEAGSSYVRWVVQAMGGDDDG